MYSCQPIGVSCCYAVSMYAMLYAMVPVCDCAGVVVVCDMMVLTLFAVFAALTAWRTVWR